MKRIALLILTLIFLDATTEDALSIGITSAPGRPPKMSGPEIVVDPNVKFPTNLTSTDNLADYLIITADPFYKSPPTVKLANHRAQHSDFQVAVIRLSDIYAQFPDANHEISIKNFVSFAYYNWRNDPQVPFLKYVLLVGDADLDKSDQPWFLPVHASDAIASYGRWTDNYYVAIDDDDNNGVLNDWDSAPEMRIGRFPVKTVSELSIVVNKTISYEIKNTPNQEWLKKVFFAFGNIEGSNIFDPYSFGFSGKSWVDIEKIFTSAHKELVGILGSAPPQDVADVINSGVGIFLFRGHGWIDQMNGFFGLKDLPLLSNGPYYPIVFSIGCQTGRFQNEEYDSLGEEFLLGEGKGSVAFIGAAHTSEIWLDEHNAKYIPEELFGEGIKTIGDVILNWKNRDDVATVDRQVYNLLGDPGLDMTKVLTHTSVKADATLSNLEFSNENPAIGEMITLNVSADNLGSISITNAEISFYKGNPDDTQTPGTLIGSQQSITIAPGNSVALSQFWTVDAWGNFSIYVKITAAEEELFKENNKIDKETKYITCMNAWPQKTDGIILRKNVADVHPHYPGHEVVATSTDGRVYVWRGDGTSLPGWEGGKWLDGEQSKIPTVGDIDPNYPGLEIVVASTDRRVYAFHADGTPLIPNSNGIFTILEVDNPIYPIVADLDLNYPGKEIIIPTYFDFMYAFHADGTSMIPGTEGVFAALGQGFEFLQGLIVADIDLNGDLEVVAVTEHNIYDTQGKYLNDEALAFAWHHDGSRITGWENGIQVSTNGTGNATPIAADMDLNYPGLEIVFGNTDPENIVILHNDGSLMPGWNLSFPDLTYARHNIVVGDIDPTHAGLELVVVRWSYGAPETIKKKLHVFHSDGTPMAGWENGIDLPQGLNYFFNIDDANLVTLADVDGDNEMEIVVGGFDGFIWAYENDTTPVAGWGDDKRAGYRIFDAPSLADIDGNGTLDLIVGSFDRSVYAWDLGIPLNPQKMDWPLWRKDPANTGAF
jgi:hypothetical protein